MPPVRRTAYLFLYAQERGGLDVDLLLQGTIEVERSERLLAVSILAGEEYALSPDELRLLLSVPSDRWTRSEDHALVDLARKGLVVADDADPLLSELRRRDELLTAEQWHPYAALQHFGARWRDVGLGLESRRWLQALEDPTGAHERLVSAFGPPPPAFHSLDRGAARELPLPRRPHGLYELLDRRRTSRVFDGSQPLGLEELSVLLYEVFGARGYRSLGDGLVVLGKSSPSGGARHPIEAYPLLLNVEGFEPGLYHYDVRRHACEPLETLDRAEAARLAVEFASGQTWVGEAAALFVMTSRFFRSFWKYRRHNRVLLTICMDAGHLSQTFYLVCTELGLGAFFTAAVNGHNIEERLGLDGYAEGALALCGCGTAIPGAHPLQAGFEPFLPRETDLPPEPKP